MQSKLAGPFVVLSLVGFGALVPWVVLGGAPSPSARAAEPAKPKPDLPLDISKGQSLAQTGPNGTMMGFACDYRFRAGSRNAKSKYVLVVKDMNKKSAEVPFDLEDEGEFAAFVDGWKPRDAPFEGHFEEIIDKTRRRVVSQSIDFDLEPSQKP